MTWTAKVTYEHWNEDVLLLLHLGLSERIKEITDDRFIAHKIYLRSDDRTYAEMYFVWKDKETFLEWMKANPDFSDERQKIGEYLNHFGIVRSWYDPPYENYEWAEHPSNRPDKVEFPKHVIRYDDIFTPPG